MNPVRTCLTNAILRHVSRHFAKFAPWLKDGKDPFLEEKEEEPLYDGDFMPPPPGSKREKNLVPAEKKKKSKTQAKLDDETLEKLGLKDIVKLRPVPANLNDTQRMMIWWKIVNAGNQRWWRIDRSHVFEPNEETRREAMLHNIPRGTSFKEIKKLFHSLKGIEEIEDVKFARWHDSGRWRPFCWIRFATKEQVKLAMQIDENALELHGKSLMLKQNVGREVLQRPSISAEPGPRPVRCRTICVMNVPFEMPNDDLWVMFRDCGLIRNAYTMKQQYTGRSRGFAFVEFWEEIGALRAMKYRNLSKWQDRVLILKWAPVNSSDLPKYDLENRTRDKQKQRRQF